MDFHFFFLRTGTIANSEVLKRKAFRKKVKWYYATFFELIYHYLSGKRISLEKRPGGKETS